MAILWRRLVAAAGNDYLREEKVRLVLHGPISAISDCGSAHRVRPSVSYRRSITRMPYCFLCASRAFLVDRSHGHHENLEARADAALIKEADGRAIPINA
jgi:hypothetical protein